MGLVYRALGLMAYVNEVLGRIAVYHVRLNWILLAVLLWYFGDGATHLASRGPGGAGTHSPLFAVMEVSLSATALALIAVCWMQRNTIFRPATFLARNGVLSRDQDPAAAPLVDLRVTGRFDRGHGNSLMLRDFPARWDISETGAISIETRVTDVGTFDSIPPLSGDPSGSWSLIVPRETLTHGLEDGVLYYGLSARPALRLSLPGRRTTAILSVTNTAQLIALCRTFDALLADSAAKEAIFYSTLKQNLDQPAPTHNPEPADTVKKSGDAIPWEKLIDFSG
jgi:hypothetical protein